MANTSLLAAFERMWQHVTYALIGKSDISHNHNDTYYTESEIDTKISSVNTSITNITNGTTKVGKATVADSAATATSATTASTATKATQDDNGKVISSTYETKADATSKLTEAKTYTDSAVSDKADANHNHDNDYDTKGSAETVQDALDAHTDNTDIHFTATERTKLSGIEAGAQKNAVTGIKGNSESSYRTGNVNITKANVGLGNVDNTSDANKPVSTAQQTAIDSALDTAKQYTDTKTSGLASSSSVTSAISSHNSSTSAHSDIRDSIDTVATESKEYTDELIADEVTARNSVIAIAKNSAISTASSDATTKANNALSSAKTYTDSSLATAKAYSDTNLATAKSYTDTKFDAIMGEGASETLDTIGEISEAIQTHQDVTDALNSAIGTKANASDLTSHTSNKSNPHGVTLSQLGVTATKDELNVLDGITATTAELNYMDGVTSNVQTQLDGKAANSHGSHVSYSTTAPKMDGTASAGSASTVARTDHVHPTDTSRASQTDLDALAEVVNGKAPSSHSHEITAGATDDDVVVLTGTKGTNGVSYSASHANSGVSAGTYKSVTVNAKGHVTAGTNPTTLSGYGITNAYTKAEVDGLLDDKSDVGHSHSIANVTNLQSTLDGKSAVGHNHLYYGVCSTAADTAAKTVTVDNFSLVTGAMVIVKFSNANSASSPTLNVNNTGAKPICRYGTTAASTSTSTTGWRAGAVQIFVYDGTSWIRDFWENTTYSNVSLGQGYATCSTAAATIAKVGTLSSYALATGGIVSVKFTYAVPASATLNINSQGAKSIYFRGSAITGGVIKAGDVATFIYSSQYHLIAIDRWQNDISSLQTAVDSLSSGKSDTTHTHAVATTSANGFMSADDKEKLNGISPNANNYVLPTASSTLGGVKTTSTVTSTTGLTACPIISGVPYYKDTNTTYTLGSFGITATAAELNALDGITATVKELNCCDGVTSNIQTQIDALDDAKSDTGHTHNYAGSSSAGGAATSANKLNTNAGSATQPVYFSNGVPVATTYALNKTVPSDAVFTDTNNKVTQTITTTNANYRVLLSSTADDTTRTEGARKDANFYYNPSTNALSVGSIVMGDATMTYDSTVHGIVITFV